MAHSVQGLPCHRTVFGVDTEKSTERMDPERARLRKAMFALVEQALTAGGITEACRDEYLDRGDSAVALIHPLDQIPDTVLLDTVVPTLALRLTEYNESNPDHAFRLRAVVGAGRVSYDSRGPYGEALDAAFRLLEARGLKKLLRATTAPMVVVVSDEVYRHVVMQGYEGIERSGWTRVPPCRVSGNSHGGWARPTDPPQDLGELAGAEAASTADYRRQA